MYYSKEVITLEDYNYIVEDIRIINTMNEFD